MKRIILTGAPHAGKSTILAELKKRGFRVVEESAIIVIETLQELLGDYESLIWRDTHFSAFQALIGHRQKRLEDSTISDDFVFFDRGRIDNVAFANYFKQNLTIENKILADTAKYDQVFILDIIEPFKDRHESGRIEDRKMAYELQDELHKTYASYGFDIVHVPQLEITERIEFILSRLK